jgi:hypothetical protein
MSYALYGRVEKVLGKGTAVGAFLGVQTGYDYLVGGGLFVRSNGVQLILTPGTGENKWTIGIALRGAI